MFDTVALSDLQTYPDDPLIMNNLGTHLTDLGRLDDALQAHVTSYRMRVRAPNSGNLARAYLRLGRLEEAETILAEAFAKGFAGSLLRIEAYRLAHIQGDVVQAERHLAWLAEHDGEEARWDWEAQAAIFFRGEAFLGLGDYAAAAAEFQKIISNRGLASFSVFFPLAHLHLGRALAR